MDPTSVVDRVAEGQMRDFGHTDGRLTSHVEQGRATTLIHDDSDRIASLAGADSHTYTYDTAVQKWIANVVRASTIEWIPPTVDCGLGASMSGPPCRTWGQPGRPSP
jgi:hypothetical protein